MRALRPSPPVGSPLQYYAGRGRSSSLMRDAAPQRSSPQRFTRGNRRAPLRMISRDLLLLTLLAAAPLHAHPTDAPTNVTLTFTAATLAATGVALLVGAVGGMILGALWHSALLRDADDTVTSHRARTLARIFDASTCLQGTVDALVRDAHVRITALQTTLTRIRAKEHRHDD